MADKIKLFELNIDVDAAIKKTAEMRDTADQLKIKYDALRKSSSSSTEEIIKARGEYDAANQQYRKAQKEVTKLTELKGKEITTVEQGRAALSVLNKRWTETASLYGKNSKEAEEYAKKSKDVRNRLKELEGAVGDNTRNVGNYTESFKSAIQQSGLFGQAQQTVNNITSAGGPIITFISTNLKQVGDNYKKASVDAAGMTRAQVAAKVSSIALSGALKILKTALIATGIGAIVVALGALASYLTKTQRGADLVSKVMKAVGVAFDVIIDRISQFGEGLTLILSGKVSAGFDKIANSAKGLGDELQREVGLAYELEAAFQALRDKEIGLIETQAERKRQIEELRIAAKDELKPLQERAALLEEAGNIEKEALADKIAIAKEDARISAERLALGESTREDIKANAEAQARVIELETESLKLQRSIETEKQSLLKRARAEEEAARKERIAAAKEATDAAIQESKTRLAIFLEENKERAASLGEALRIEEEARDRRLKILEDEVAAGKKTKADAELEELQTKNSFLEEQKALTEDFAAQELEAFKDNHAARLDNNQLLTDALVQQEKDRLEQIAQAERDYQTKRLEAGIISQQEYNKAIAAIDEEARIAKAETDAELEAQRKEKEAIDFENRVALESENFLQSLELEKERLEMKRQAEVEAAAKTGADISLINQKYAEQQKKIDEDKAEFKRDVASQTFGTLAELLGKESAAGKAAAIAQTTIDTYSAATAAYKAMAGIPVVGPALGAIAAAAAVASGLKTVRSIVSTKKPNIPKAAKGITLDGRSHAAGGETLYNSAGDPLVEAEAGENVYVLNKKASGLINSLSYLNQATGGVPLTRATRYAAAGGMIQKAVTGQNGINYEALSASLAEAYSALPPSYVAVKEINDGQGRFAEVKEGANF